ncbi:MAG: hypothetical protein J0I98_00425 [Mesorhizobium sp.]|nr:hypothetical protein [Mesorhizobium sp.]MBN9241238.1 hypothetical protein [Mesorhizobium sp.]
MSLNDAHAFAFSLATTLMAAIIIFQAGDGTFSITPASEYDGDIAAIVHDYDPREIMSRIEDAWICAADRDRAAHNHSDCKKARS